MGLNAALARTGVVLLLPTAILSAGAPASPRTQLATARQLVVVTTPDWNSVDGTLRRYDRAAVTDPWTAVGPPVPIVVGRAGMAWDASWRDPKVVTGPVKAEGDGRSPAGVFTLTRAFGYDPAPSASRMLYTQAIDALECVDDPRSRYYNQLVDRRAAQPDWTSAEQMHRPDDLYRLGVVVDYNVQPAVPGHGSCIFLHIWDGPGRGTAGCTAMTAPEMAQAVDWLQPDAHPVLVQFPQPVFDRLRGTWRLP
ncbi:MAG: L,D-transpeptidase family protein [Vicinamibacterales bacterium]